MKRYLFQNSEIGFYKWCKVIPYVRHFVTSFYTYTSKQYQKDHLDEYKECRIVYRQYKELSDQLNEEEKDYFHKYFIARKIPPYEKRSSVYRNKIITLWKEILFVNHPRPIKRIDCQKLGVFLKEKRKDAGYSRDDIQVLIGINVVSLTAIEEGRMDVKATHLYSMLWLYGEKSLEAIEMFDKNLHENSLKALKVKVVRQLSVNI